MKNSEGIFRNSFLHYRWLLLICFGAIAACSHAQSHSVELKAEINYSGYSTLLSYEYNTSRLHLQVGGIYSLSDQSIGVVAGAYANLLKGDHWASSLGPRYFYLPLTSEIKLSQLTLNSRHAYHWPTNVYASLGVGYGVAFENALGSKSSQLTGLIQIGCGYTF